MPIELFNPDKVWVFLKVDFYRNFEQGKQTAWLPDHVKELIERMFSRNGWQKDHVHKEMENTEIK